MQDEPNKAKDYTFIDFDFEPTSVGHLSIPAASGQPSEYDGISHVVFVFDQELKYALRLSAKAAKDLGVELISAAAILEASNEQEIPNDAGATEDRPR